MRFKKAAPEQREGEWLLAEDEGSRYVTTGMQIEGDVFHLGWSTKVGSDAETVVTLPEIERLMSHVALAIDSAIDAFKWDDAAIEDGA